MSLPGAKRQKKVVFMSSRCYVGSIDILLHATNEQIRIFRIFVQTCLQFSINKSTRNESMIVLTFNFRNRERAH